MFRRAAYHVDKFLEAQSPATGGATDEVRPNDQSENGKEDRPHHSVECAGRNLWV